MIFREFPDKDMGRSTSGTVDRLRWTVFGFLWLMIFLSSGISLLYGQYTEDNRPDFLIRPYLQFATESEISLLWETTHPATSTVLYGKSRYDIGEAILDKKVEEKSHNTMHEIMLDSLDTGANYFYQVISVTETGDILKTDILPFKTAPKEKTPFAFTVFSDSQSNPEIWKKITNQALRERPDFALHAGDLVGLGYRKNEWIYDFFAPSYNFMKQVPVYTTLGNHEHDAAYYYQYFKNPVPEHYYSFTYGNAEFFLIDTNQYQEPGTLMYHWLEHALASSDAVWKMVIMHHPPYTSEENDYGDTHFERSRQGDAEAKGLIPLFENYGVDIVFYGHIHMYERTWPILNDEPVDKDGVIYINTGGSGGRLEQAAPTRAWFTNKVRTAYHFAYVAIQGETLQYQAIDDEGQVFDQFVLLSGREKKLAEELPPVTPKPKRERRVFRDTMHVYLETVNSSDNIVYTLDGSEPDLESKQVKGPVVLDKSATLKTTAFNEHGHSSVATYEYTKMEPLAGKSHADKFRNGINYQYYTGILDDEKETIANQLNFESSGAIQILDLDKIPHQKSNWGAVLSGYLEVPETGYYRFNGHAYHIFRFYLHGRLMIEEYNREIDGVAEVYLEEGLHPFEIEFHTHRPYNYMRFEYTGPDGIRKPITDLKFYRE
ncbi:MAG: metallophosphoesterase [Balneolales bacterium]